VSCMHYWRRRRKARVYPDERKETAGMAEKSSFIPIFPIEARTAAIQLGAAGYAVYESSRDSIQNHT